jgi:hypothetical protein
MTTLESLEGEYCGDPPPAATYLVSTVHRLRSKAISSFSPEDLRIMIGQGIDLDHLIPVALNALEVDPLVEGDYYPGDLLTAVSRVERAYWLAHLDGLRLVEEIVSGLIQLDEPVSTAVREFRARSGSENWAREARQLTFISYALQQYREGRSDLRRLAEDLYALAQEIRLAPDEWVSDLQAEENSLEVLYAVALDSGFADDLPDRYLRDMDEAVERVEMMLRNLGPRRPL